LTLFVRT